jgi:hypothetical protein
MSNYHKWPPPPKQKHDWDGNGVCKVCNLCDDIACCPESWDPCEPHVEK